MHVFSYINDVVVYRKRAAELQKPVHHYCCSSLIRLSLSLSLRAMAQKSIVSSSFSSSLSSFSMSLFPFFFTRAAFREHQSRKENMSSIEANVRCLRKPLDASNVPTHSASENFQKWENKKDAQRHIVIIICHFIFIFEN